MPKYKLCPRCELNYITEDEDLCDVCKAQLDNSEDLFEDDDEELCPICGQNLVEPGEKYCAECLEKRASSNVDDDDSNGPTFVLDSDENVAMSLDDAIAEEEVEDEAFDDSDSTYQEDLIDDIEVEDEEEALLNEELKGEFEDEEEVEEIEDEDIVEDDEFEKEMKNIKIDESDFLEDDEEDELEARKKKLKEDDDE